MLRMKYIILFVAVAAISLITLLPQAEAGRTVCVGWYDFSPLSTYQPAAIPPGADSQVAWPGVYGGYTYEYLRLISQVNGWNLRFVYGTINESLARLERGEVDIVGGVGRFPAREAKFAFPVNSALRTTIGLIGRADDLRFNMNDFDSFAKMKVGAVAGSNPLYKIQTWSKARNIKLQLAYYDSYEQMYRALYAGEVDAIADSMLALKPNLKTLVNAETQDVYFIGNKNNPQLIHELDDAITQIQYLKPGYQEALASKYLYAQTHNSFILNRREREYLDALTAAGQPVKVAFSAKGVPIEYFDELTGAPRGIMADIFVRISQLTGLSFEYIHSLDDTQAADKADIIAAMSNDFDWADSHNAYLTQAVFDVPIFMVTTPEQGSLDVVALEKTSHLAKTVKEHMGQDMFAVRYIYLDTVEECLAAVRDGEAGRTYVNAYELNYYMNQRAFANLKFQPVPGISETMSIGISKNADPLLCSVICQALRSISSAEMNSIILKNTTFKAQHGIMDMVYTYPVASMVAAALLALLLGGIVFFYYSSEKNRRLRTQLEDILKSRMSLLQANAQLNHLSQYDTLTGIPNRRGLDEFLAKGYQHSEQVIIGMIDIDEFKKFNDTYGHLAGDKALVTVARIMKQHAMVTGNFVARFGGEEFVWVDTIHISSAAADILEKLRIDIFNKKIDNEQAGSRLLTISIGYAQKQAGEGW